jgi:hypothetical protein
MLTDVMNLRGVLIRQLVEMEVRNFKDVDSCCTTACTPTANTTARVTELRKVLEKDGIHFTAEGHQNLAGDACSCIKTLIYVAALCRTVSTRIGDTNATHGKQFVELCHAMQ